MRIDAVAPGRKPGQHVLDQERLLLVGRFARRRTVAEKFGLGAAQCFENYDRFFENPVPADAVLIDPEHSDQPALHAEWTAATDDEQTEVAYTLYVNLTDRDMFSGPVVIDKGAALTHDFTHGELNQLLLNTFDLEAGTEAAVRFAVYAKNADEEIRRPAVGDQKLRNNSRRRPIRTSRPR